MVLDPFRFKGLRFKVMVLGLVQGLTEFRHEGMVLSGDARCTSSYTFQQPRLQSAPHNQRLSCKAGRAPSP